jgi:ABC-type lipoprotein export system ATPase subunit
VAKTPTTRAPPFAIREATKEISRAPLEYGNLRSMTVEPASKTPLPNAPPLTAVGVRRLYESRAVLDGVDLTVAAGERVALMGPSGSGKTTLLNCLGGVDRPDSGQVVLCGRALDQLDRNGLARLRRESVGTIFQFFHLLPTLSVAENVELPLQLIGLPASERRSRVDRLLDRVGLGHRAHGLPSELSGGEMQRVAIARALAHRPALLLADEPTGNLDSANGASVLALIREMTDESGAALVLVTHSEEAAAICHRLVHLRDGRIVAQELCGHR